MNFYIIFIILIQSLICSSILLPTIKSALILNSFFLNSFSIIVSLFPSIFLYDLSVDIEYYQIVYINLLNFAIFF